MKQKRIKATENFVLKNICLLRAGFSVLAAHKLYKFCRPVFTQEDNFVHAVRMPKARSFNV